MEPITIKKNERGGFDVFQGDRYSDGLAYEEMIGVVIALTQAEQYLDRFRHWVRTEEEWRRTHPWMFREEDKPKETLLLKEADENNRGQI